MEALGSPLLHGTCLRQKVKRAGRMLPFQVWLWQSVPPPQHPASARSLGKLSKSLTARLLLSTFSLTANVMFAGLKHNYRNIGGAKMDGKLRVFFFKKKL